MKTLLKNYSKFVLFLGALFISCNNQDRKDEKSTDEHYEEGNIIVDKDIKIFYQKVGDGPEKIVIPMGFLLYDDFKILANEDRTLLFYDMRNRARSSYLLDSTQITIEKDVEDVEMIRKHFNWPKIDIIGESYLGLMVVMYALKYPENVEDIVQIGAVPLKSSWWSQYPEELRNNQSNVDSLAYSELLRLHREEHYLENDYEFSKMYYEVFEHPDLVADTSYLKKMGPQWKNHLNYSNELYSNYSRHLNLHFSNSVSKLDIPEKEIKELNNRVLIIHGTLDRNAPYGSGIEWAYLLNNSKLLTIENAAHIPWVENPDLVFNSIDEFLKGRWPASAKEIINRPIRNANKEN